ncbi:MAG: PD-(D/E)XK nuclease family protein [Planctomycetes bacterium]|nr:PD-(D/E)XK nuclease family protein [Planctomycetota bacterium]
MPGADDNTLVFELEPIPTVSPSLAETLRNCPLQAALSRVSSIRGLVLGNPKAWLGTAYHEVLKKLWSPTGEVLTDDELVEHLWASAINTARQRATAHPLNRRFAEPERWPGYCLARACVQIRAQEALAEQPRQAAITEASGSSAATVREQDLTAMNGKLAGKPDVVMDEEIRDYKSGRIYDETPDGTKTIKEAYVRQLHLYGHLVNETRGHCPRKGRLLPIQGETAEIDLHPEMCAAEAAEAVNLLDAFNTQLANASDASDLATPSAAACRWCQFKALCPAFWSTVNEDWAQELGSAAVCGVLKESPALIHNGRAFSITIAVRAGTTEATDVTIAPVEKAVHGDLANLQVGDAVRIVNLYQRRNGQLAPTSATLCFREADCPSFIPRGAAP